VQRVSCVALLRGAARAGPDDLGDDAFEVVRFAYPQGQFIPKVAHDFRRILQEPGRLARRYLLDDPPFFWWMIRDRWLSTRPRG
jgi:hypothetical protein